MFDRNIIKSQLGQELFETNFSIPHGSLYRGKVRDNYQKDDYIIMITTDRISAFDCVLGAIPFKGQVLNQIAVFGFEKTKDIIKNHIIEIPDPNVMIVRKVETLPIEMVVRGYITGSLWRSYNSGERKMYGITFPDNLKKHQKFSSPIITPSTKAEIGKHDLPIAKKEIIEDNIIPEKIYTQLEDIALALFERGTELSAKQNLILVDTKYEFGIDKKTDEIILIDEVHTPDSSRYWHLDRYEELFSQSKDQIELNKEYVRQWLIANGFSGDGTPPLLPDEVKIESSARYIEIFEILTNTEFKAETGNPLERIKKNIAKKFWVL